MLLFLLRTPQNTSKSADPENPGIRPIIYKFHTLIDFITLNNVCINQKAQKYKTTPLDPPKDPKKAK